MQRGLTTDRTQWEWNARLVPFLLLGLALSAVASAHGQGEDQSREQQRLALWLLPFWERVLGVCAANALPVLAWLWWNSDAGSRFRRRSPRPAGEAGAVASLLGWVVFSGLVGALLLLGGLVFLRGV